MEHAPTGLSRRVQVIADRLAPASSPDGALLARWHGQRDEAAFAELVRRHGRLVWGVCRRATTDADDAYQAVFLLLARRAGRLSGRDTVAPWLHLTAVRVSRRAVRTASRRQAKERAAAKPETVSPPEPADWRPKFDAVVAGLPARYREAVVLCELGGLSRAEAASRLCVPVGTLASRLAAARVLLRRRLVRRGVTAGVLAAVGNPPVVTAGVAGAAARQLAQRIITMTILKILALVSVVAGVGLAVWPHRTAPAAVYAPPAEYDWKAEFRKAYGLADGQVVRRVPPPYPAVRERYLTATYGPEGASNGSIPLDRHYVCFSWRDSWPTPHTRLTLPVAPAEGLPLGRFLVITTGKPEFEQRVDAALQDSHVTGDFVVREGADPAAVVAALVPILRSECGLAVTFRLEPTEREVYVVTGRYAAQPLGGRKPGQIDLFAEYRKPKDDRTGGGGSGTLDEFLTAAGRFVERPMVVEVEGDRPKQLEWRYHARNKMRLDPANGIDDRAHDHDPETVLRNVSVQTGLTFTKQKRTVRVLVAEPAK